MKKHMRDRRPRENKYISKDILAQKLRQRAEKKKNYIKPVKKWRKQRLQSGFAGNVTNVWVEIHFKGQIKSGHVCILAIILEASTQAAGKGKSGADKKRKGMDLKIRSMDSEA